MNILDLNSYMIMEIILYIDRDNLYQFKETCKDFYHHISVFYKGEHKSPTINTTVSSIKMIEWAKNHPTFKYNIEHSLEASNNYKMKVLKYILKDGCPFNNYIYTTIFNNFNKNRLKMIKWLVRNNYKDNDELLMINACHDGLFYLVKWLYNKNFKYDEEAFNRACIGGRLPVVKFLLNKGCPWNSYAYDYAALAGHIHILKYLYNRSKNDLSMPIWGSETIVSAVEGNQLETIKYLREHKCQWNIMTTYIAIHNNNYEILEWLVRNKCPFDEHLVQELIDNKLVNL